MSRIHEALKRAEEEKAQSRSAHEAKPLDSLVTEAVQPDGAGWPGLGMRLPPGPGTASPTFHHLRLDELRQRCSILGWKLSPDYVVFNGGQSFTLCAEEFRTLRSRLYRLRDKRPFRTLLITSTLPGEGKSFVALNLALAIVRQNERRALLIDADLRASRLHVRMGAPCAPGLTEYLSGKVDEFSIIQADPKDDLFFIPAGRSISNPAELLAGDRLKVLLVRLAPVFDWIIVDAPPVCPVSDASVVAGLCDGVIVVVRANSTPHDMVETTLQEFRDRNLLGVVLNGAERKETYGAYSYYAGNGMDKR